MRPGTWFAINGAFHTYLALRLHATLRVVVTVTADGHFLLCYLTHFFDLFLCALACFLRRDIEIGAGGGETRALMLGAGCIEMSLHQSGGMILLHQAFDVSAVDAVSQQVLLIFCATVW